MTPTQVAKARRIIAWRCYPHIRYWNAKKMYIHWDEFLLHCRSTQIEFGCKMLKHFSKRMEWYQSYNGRRERKPKWLYRLEYKDNSCGLWYNGNGEWCFEHGIGSLDDSCKTKSLPMDYDERYKAGGKDWFSSCSHKEDLLHWYSAEDARTLLANGFVFTRYLAVDYTEYDMQTVFLKETALRREEIDFFALMKK